MIFEEMWKNTEITLTCNWKQLKEICEKFYNEGYKQCDEDNKLDLQDEQDEMAIAWEEYRIEDGLPAWSGDKLKFAQECHAADLEVRNYSGRMYYNGPAVVCDDVSEVMSVVSVKCQWDNMGLRFVVYPKGC